MNARPPNPLFDIDFYKSGHHRQYPPGTEAVYSNFTARSSKFANIPEEARDGVVFFGLRNYLKRVLVERWNNGFFSRPRDEVVGAYKYRLDRSLGGDNDVSHIAQLHDYGRLPILIRALDEGCLVPIGVPMLTIQNTVPEFFWLTNFLETSLSAYLWKPIVSATAARFYRRICESAASESCDNNNHVDYQCHDFSMRGMSGVDDAALSGAGHLLFFRGTDTIPAIELVRDVYGADDDVAPIGASVPATEHSVMSMGGIVDEFETFRRLIETVYPAGLLSIVADTWDFWRVITEYMPKLKDLIEARDGKIVIRPDSGDPVKIICGDPDAPEGSIQHVGAVRGLAETFGWEQNSKGYLRLNPKVGLIYGDSITPERAQTILSRLLDMGIATDCVVFGVGSYTYQMVTRDTWGMAVKATYGVVDGFGRFIFKSPKTDAGTKKSLTGMVGVYQGSNGDLYVEDKMRFADPHSLLETVFINGAMTETMNFHDIRDHAKQWL